MDRWQEERVLTISLHMRTMVDAQASMLGMVMLDTKIKKPPHTQQSHTPRLLFAASHSLACGQHPAHHHTSMAKVSLTCDLYLPRPEPRQTSGHLQGSGTQWHPWARYTSCRNLPPKNIPKNKKKSYLGLKA